jgi:MFS family permease
MRRLVWLLAALSLVGYALRTNISIAQEYMAPELGLSIVGWAIASFLSALVGGGAGLAFATLFGARFFLGATEAATYPVMAMVAAQEIPEARRLSATAFYISAGSLGTALAPVTLAQPLGVDPCQSIRGDPTFHRVGFGQRMRESQEPALVEDDVGAQLVRPRLPEL